MADGPKCVALSTPAWPRGASPNGIVTYTAELEGALREIGVRPIIMSWHVAPTLEEVSTSTQPSCTDVVDISEFEPRRTLVNRVLSKASRALGSDSLLATRFKMIERAVRAAKTRFPIEVLEIEEAHGIAKPVLTAGLLPVVVRLHGPWFLNGRALGVKEDAAFERRDRLAAPRSGRARAAPPP